MISNIQGVLLSSAVMISQLSPDQMWFYLLDEKHQLQLQIDGMREKWYNVTSLRSVVPGSWCLLLGCI